MAPILSNNGLMSRANYDRNSSLQNKSDFSSKNLSNRFDGGSQESSTGAAYEIQN